MKKFALLSVCVVTFLLSAAFESFGCTCGLPYPAPPLEQQVANAQKKAKAVFTGKVIEVARVAESYYVRVKFKTDRIWKGNLTETVTILTGRGGGDCGYSFETGKSYLVYAYGADDNKLLGAGICSRTNVIEGASEDLRILGKGSFPKKRMTKAASKKTGTN